MDCGMQFAICAIEEETKSISLMMVKQLSINRGF